MKDVKVEVPEGYEAVWDEAETTVRIVEKRARLDVSNFYLEQSVNDIRLKSREGGKNLLEIYPDGTMSVSGGSLGSTSAEDGFITDKTKLELRT